MPTEKKPTPYFFHNALLSDYNDLVGWFGRGSTIEIGAKWDKLAEYQMLMRAQLSTLQTELKIFSSVAFLETFTSYIRGYEMVTMMVEVLGKALPLDSEHMQLFFDRLRRDITLGVDQARTFAYLVAVRSNVAGAMSALEFLGYEESLKQYLREKGFGWTFEKIPEVSWTK